MAVSLGRLRMPLPARRRIHEAQADRDRVTHLLPRRSGGIPARRPLAYLRDHAVAAARRASREGAPLSPKSDRALCDVGVSKAVVSGRASFDRADDSADPSLSAFTRERWASTCQGLHGPKVPARNTPHEVADVLAGCWQVASFPFKSSDSTRSRYGWPGGSP